MTTMKREFGKVGGRTVYLYTLSNGSGVEASITNYGGIVTSLKMPDIHREFADVVLGFETLEEYRANSLYFGCLVGRYANRIAGGRFRLDGREYAVAQNDGANHLHGGHQGFDKVVWDSRPVDDAMGQALELTYVSRDGEEGFPGNLMVRVVYRLTELNELVIEYLAATDARTVVCLTHHSYFNLSASPTILDHHLSVRAGRVTAVDAELIPTGELQEVTGSDLDLQLPVRLGDILTKPAEYLVAGGLDHNFVLGDGDSELPAAILEDRRSGRKMAVFTTEPALQVYSGNFLDGTVTGKRGVKYQKYSGICLEAQHFPDSPNKPLFPSVILSPGEVYRQTTKYQFSAS